MPRSGFVHWVMWMRRRARAPFVGRCRRQGLWIGVQSGTRQFLPQVIGTKQLSQIDWGFRPTPISTTLAAFDTAFEYLSMTRRGTALDADPQSQRDPLLARLASPRVARHARVRDDGRDPSPGEPCTAPKKDADATTPPLIRWSIQEVRRIAIRLAQRRIQPAHIIAWSTWRRAHQAAARHAHIQSRTQL